MMVRNIEFLKSSGMLILRRPQNYQEMATDRLNFRVRVNSWELVEYLIFGPNSLLIFGVIKEILVDKSRKSSCSLDSFSKAS